MVSWWKSSLRGPRKLFLGHPGAIRVDTGKGRLGILSVYAKNGDGHGGRIAIANGIGCGVGEGIGG